MSLDGTWPSWAGLPELSGVPRQERDKRINAMIRETLATPQSSGAAPIDLRIESFLTEHLAEVRSGEPVKLPPKLSLHHYGMARALSLPSDGDVYISPLIKSYRCLNGVLHNPVSDKRTTKGVFHVAEGGFPIADDKKAVPLDVFSKLLDTALQPPAESLEVPYTINETTPRQAWVSVMLRPLVCPEVPSYCTEKRFEVRVLAPGSMVANLDFLESIFGNAGEASLPENDAALDVEHWNGTTGCIILAPHLLGLGKKELGLPHWDAATERQRRDGMAWKDESERYNNGGAFKICTRTASGVFVTIITDNYFGYCKKEVKTQMSFSCNFFGTEEEHAGGALAWASRSWGGQFLEDYRVLRPNHHYGEPVEPFSFRGAMRLLEDEVIFHETEGYAVDRTFPDIVFVPEGATANISTGKVSWSGGEVFLVPGTVYIHPSGYQICLEKRLDKTGWHIRGTVAEPVNCHKPSTVSGGGKSEISKLLSDMITFGNALVDNTKIDLSYVDMILKRDYSDRFPSREPQHPSLLDPKVTLGSVIKMLTPSDDHCPDYNTWLDTIPRHIRSLVFLVKHFYKPEWGKDWKSHITAQMVDGAEAHSVHVDGKKVATQYLRIGVTPTHLERKFQLRYDFVPAQKIQTEDDISSAIIVPRDALEHLNVEITNPAVKMLKNCELRLFQRPDDAIVRGCDTKCEEDMAQDGTFMSNFEPLTVEQAALVTKQAVAFDEFTEPMQRRLSTAAEEEDRGKYVVSSNHFRIVDGKPTANPRYLQVRTDFCQARERRVAEVAARLRRHIPRGKPAHFPVNGVLPGRRNNPPDTLKDGTPIRPLAVFNPIHFQDLPELFMEFISSLTGKSPSTTGAGSEGALTKGPFNALRFTADLNATLVGMILTGYSGFSSAAGYIGRRKVDHDISLLIPELWCRMSEEERDPAYMIKHGLLEKVEDIELNGQRVLASRLGYRVTNRFVRRFLVRIFETPDAVFDEAMLKPESQDMLMFVDGVNNIVEAQARTAKAYIADGSISDACPPLRATLYIMAEGRTPEGLTADSPEYRALFKREEMLKSAWYRERLAAKQSQEIVRLQRCIAALQDFLARPENASDTARLGITERLASAEKQLEVASSSAFVDSLVGTSGSDPTLLR
mmetsp:Transcript_39355/g.94264  ORF Transcript_39355/g.94264 Transcript_39355/m.94264 type:complete len:1133 (+) Transcript_39355:82-3480(+)